jgi:hypothetical protein
MIASMGNPAHPAPEQRTTALESREWPPRVGMRVELAGTEGAFEVIKCTSSRSLGQYIVLRAPIDGGWKAWPITEAEWYAAGFRRCDET